MLINELGNGLGNGWEMVRNGWEMNQKDVGIIVKPQKVIEKWLGNGEKRLGNGLGNGWEMVRNGWEMVGNE